MSYKIIQSSTNSDRVSRFGVTSGTPDSVITFPNETGEVATTSDLPKGPTIYPLLTAYTDKTTNDPQNIVEWNFPVVAGKTYELEYSIYANRERTNTSFNPQLYFQTSSFTSQCIFALHDYKIGTYSSGTPDANMSTAVTGIFFYPVLNNSKDIYAHFSGFLKATETGTVRHLIQNAYGGWSPGDSSSSFDPNGSFLKVTELY